VGSEQGLCLIRRHRTSCASLVVACRTYDQRPLLFFFRGNLGSTFVHGRQEAR